MNFTSLTVPDKISRQGCKQPGELSVLCTEVGVSPMHPFTGGLVHTASMHPAPTSRRRWEAQLGSPWTLRVHFRHRNGLEILPIDFFFFLIFIVFISMII